MFLQFRVVLKRPGFCYMNYYYDTLYHCSIKPSLQNNNDIMNLASTLAGNFMGVVQYNRDNRAFEVSKVTAISFPSLVCQTSFHAGRY